MEARDYIAIVTVLGGMILLALGVDSFVGGILLTVISYYFGMGHYEKRTRNNWSKYKSEAYERPILAFLKKLRRGVSAPPLGILQIFQSTSTDDQYWANATNKLCYLTASLSAFPALNTGAFLALILSFYFGYLVKLVLMRVIF